MTTINDGRFLVRFKPMLAAAQERFDLHLSLIITGDRKTPAECADTLAATAREGFDVVFLDLKDQLEILEAAGLRQDFIPYDSDNRRNIATLAALQRGADVLVSLDDDNWPKDAEQFLSIYAKVGTQQMLPLAQCEGPWPNLCASLDIRSGWTGRDVTVFARGHPIARRSPNSAAIDTGDRIEAKVLAHIGLWEGQPDVDAATRASLAPICHGSRIKGCLISAANARAPMSTQNLAIDRSLAPAWWYVRMGPLASGRKLDRFGDMFQGYFSSMVLEAIGARFAFGAPLVTHDRNPHTLMRDLEGEMAGMALLEDLLDFIESTPTGATSSEAYTHIAQGLVEALPRNGGLLGQDALRWANETSDGMQRWSEACGKLMN